MNAIWIHVPVEYLRWNFCPLFWARPGKRVWHFGKEYERTCAPAVRDDDGMWFEVIPAEFSNFALTHLTLGRA